MNLKHNLSLMTFIATQAALKAGEILKKGFGRVSRITNKPGKQNIVTEFDQAAENAIISLINQYFPGHSILAEESGLKASSESQIIWIIDPLDGTTNFARQIPIFTVSIAAYDKEEGLTGVIYQPLTNELFIAEKGHGAFLNGEKLKVSQISNLDDALIGGGYPYSNITEESQEMIDHFSKFVKLGISLRNLGSAALALAYVAAGKLDGFWMDYLHPWDLAAGKLLVEEAGGKITHYDGKKHSIILPSNILATNQLIHEEMINQLRRTL